MRDWPLLTGAVLALFLFACATEPDSSPGTQASILPPVAKKMPVELHEHGQTRIDDYFWMRDDTRSDPEVVAYLEAENAYAEQRLEPLQALRNSLYQEMTHRIEHDYDSVPYLQRGYLYYHRYRGDDEYPVYARRKGDMSAPEEILIDAEALAQGESYFAIGDFQVSPNGGMLAYSVDTTGRGIHKLVVVDLQTGEMLADQLDEVEDSFVWSDDSSALLYVRLDLQTLLGDRVYQHDLGTQQDTDRLLYTESDITFYIALRRSLDDKTVILKRFGTSRSESLLLAGDGASAQFRSILPAEADHRYSIALSGEWIYLLSNWQAHDFRVLRVRRDQIGDKTHWQEIVPARPGVQIEEMLVLDQQLVLAERRLDKQGNIVIACYGLEGRTNTVLDFDEPGYTLTMRDNFDPSARSVRVFYESFLTPASIYDLDIETGRHNLLKQDHVAGYDVSGFAAERIMITVRDGKQVPVSVVWKKSLFHKDGSNPLLLHSYGAYGSDYDPWLSSENLSLLERGFVVANAYVRGGNMLGQAWYEDGKHLNKKNTFYDYIDVTRGLVRQGYANPGKVVAQGGSAGGLLMGSVANMAPELYLAVIAQVPFVDVITTMLDASIPLTSNEWEEWGNPAVAEDYAYMLSYSPYDEVRAQAYPNLLITAGWYDSQVQYFEPAKWVAKLRALKTDDNTILFTTFMDAGHAGNSGRLRQYDEYAMQYAFILDLLGIRQ